MVAYSIKVSEFCQLDSRADTLVSEIKKLLQHILKNNSVSDSDELREGFIKNNLIFTPPGDWFLSCSQFINHCH